MPDSGLLAKLKAAFIGKVLDSHSLHDNDTIVIDRTDGPQIFDRLKHDPEFSFAFLTDLTAVDFLGRQPRFELVYQLYSLAANLRLRVKVRLSEDDPSAPSVSSLWKCADWLEREVWDMYGISFTGHPNLRRILLYEEFRGHPLRKDYPVDQRQPLVEERDPLRNPWPAR